jgi:hypothetical protein
MDDKERQSINKILAITGETLARALMSIEILTEAVIDLNERTERLETVVVQIAKIQGGGKDVIHPN